MVVLTAPPRLLVVLAWEVFIDVVLKGLFNMGQGPGAFNRNVALRGFRTTRPIINLVTLVKCQPIYMREKNPLWP